MKLQRAVERLGRVFLGDAFSPGSRIKTLSPPRTRRVVMELLEDRRLLSVGSTVDYGDLPDNYGTTQSRCSLAVPSTRPSIQPWGM